MEKSLGIASEYGLSASLAGVNRLQCSHMLLWQSPASRLRPGDFGSDAVTKRQGNGCLVPYCSHRMRACILGKSFGIVDVDVQAFLSARGHLLPGSHPLL